MESEHEPRTPFEDPELIARAGGNQELLYRLVGLKTAKEMLEQNPTDPGLQRTVNDMEEALEAYEQGRHKQ
jgi:hypothetical protein